MVSRAHFPQGDGGPPCDRTDETGFAQKDHAVVTDPGDNHGAMSTIVT
jgi:hypothetical protein